MSDDPPLKAGVYLPHGFAVNAVDVVHELPGALVVVPAQDGKGGLHPDDLARGGDERRISQLLPDDGEELEHLGGLCAQTHVRELDDVVAPHAAGDFVLQGGYVNRHMGVGEVALFGVGKEVVPDGGEEVHPQIHLTGGAAEHLGQGLDGGQGGGLAQGGDGSVDDVSPGLDGRETGGGGQAA